MLVLTKKFPTRSQFFTTIALVATVLLVGPIRAEQPTPVRSTELPAAVDLRPNFQKWNLEPKKQGHRNTCSVFTVTAALEYALARKNSVGTPLSEDFLNWACNQIIHNRTADRGQFFSDLIRSYERYGICAAKEMPYSRSFDPDYSPSSAALASAEKIRDHAFQVHWIKPNNGKRGITDGQMAEIKATLLNGWPVCAGSYHSMLFVGYQDDPALPGGGQFLLRDSGGRNEKAMSYEMARTRLCDVVSFEAKLLLENVTPRPSPHS